MSLLKPPTATENRSFAFALRPVLTPSANTCPTSSGAFVPALRQCEGFEVGLKSLRVAPRFAPLG